ncbi:MAG: maltotransferase domain-containing protein [Verrucomicrobiia bacterium]
MNIEQGRRRVVIERVSPEIDGARFPVKRVLGEAVTVEADVFADGHDILAAVLKFRHSGTMHWTETRMEPLVNDRWQGSFRVTALGSYFYTVEGWVDHFATWRRGLEKKAKAGMELTLELEGGIPLLNKASLRAEGREAEDLRTAAQTIFKDTGLPASAKVAVALSPRIAHLMERYGERLHVTTYRHQLRVVVDPVLARFSAWFEMFPRSAAPEPGRHGTFKDCESWLPRIAQMGFDVLYLPPVHPIGRSFRKGRNNSLACGPDDPGSPWAIGSEEGGHKAVHPELGTLDDFRHLLAKARELKIEVALDIAFQCSPDHPYVRDHPGWFRKRADGSIQYAENPPKKYQDIYPLDFECEDWQALWEELKSIFEFWAEQGVCVFRVDNPHTKSFRFWEWCLGGLKAVHPDLIFLSEAFTRPKVMYRLAKLGFTQSYNYFPWRNTRHELVEYLTELTRSEVREYFRPNLWPNTPDILTQYLQFGGPPAFMARLVLAATLGASYGIYGPPFLACENQPREPGSEEYLNSEKYEVRRWDLDAAGNLAELVTRLNQVRRENPALHGNEWLRFHPVDNESLIAYSKTTEEQDDIVLVVVNLDPHHTQRGWVTLPLESWGLRPHDAYQVHDLLTDARFLWNGARNYVELDPKFVPAHLLRLRRYVRTEHDFDYFM